MDSAGFHEAFNIRVDELQVLSMEFLYNCPRPTVALLYHDNKDVRHLRTYEVSLKDKVSSAYLSYMSVRDVTDGRLIGSLRAGHDFQIITACPSRLFARVSRLFPFQYAHCIVLTC